MLLNLRDFLLFAVLVLFMSVHFSLNGNTANDIPQPIVTFLKDAPPPKVTYSKSPQKIRAIDPLGHFSNFDTEHGLALSNITCVYVDKAGNVWFGTHGGGVSIYNGKEFNTITTKNGLVHNSVWAITEDSKGNYWFGTFGGGVTMYDGVSFTSFTMDDGLVHNTVWSILDDEEGNIWFGTFGGGVSIYDGKSFSSITTEDGLTDNIVWDIIKDSNGNIWFATEGGVSKYDGKTFNNLTVKDGLAHNIVRGIVEDRIGNFWFGTFGGGVSYYNGENFVNYTEKDGLSHNVIRALIEDRYGNIWFATHGGGASMFNGRSFENFTIEQGVSHNVLRGIAEDKLGNIWLGTDGGGACRYNGKAFSIYTKNQGLAYNAVRCISEDQKGRLWFGTNGGGLSVYDGNYFYNYTVENGLLSNMIYCIYPLENGNVWLGTPEGLSLFNGKSFVSYDDSHGLAHKRVLGAFEDSKGNMWFGTADGLSMFDGKAFTTYRPEHGLVHAVVRSIAEDFDGNIWVSTYGGGVSRFDGEIFTSYTVDDGLGHNWVRKILIDSSGHIWFGTYGGGVNRYDGKTFITFSTTDGMADDVVYDMVEDEDGILWIGTNLGYSGLFFESSDGTRYTTGLLNVDNETLLNDFKPVWEIYNNQTGYPIKDLNSNAMCISENGLPFGSMQDKGLIWGGCGDDKVVCFNPKAIYRNTDPPIPIINKIKINDENICWYSLMELQRKNKRNNVIDSQIIAQQQIMTFGKLLSEENNGVFLENFKGVTFDEITRFYPVPLNLVLPHRFNQITFEFNVVETGRNFLVRYQYMLKGQDATWRPVTSNSFVTFSNLREGKYTFKLRAMSPEGVWGDTIYYDFKVLPPWYRTLWMYIVYFVIAFAALWFYIRIRLSKLSKEKIYLSKKVEERTAELLRQKEEAEEQRALVEEKNLEILEQQEEILQQKEELQIQSQELSKINSTLEDRIAEELARSRRKDYLLIQQSRQAAMGEMIANIAHQWRQPLNAVGIIIQNLQEAYEYDELTKEYLENKVKQSMNIIQYMSQTINDFRDFFKPEKNASSFNVKEAVMRSISFVDDTIKKCNIELIHSLDDEIYAFGFSNEYSQVILNLINNAKDAMLDENPKNPKIEINLTKKDDKSYLTITDNGGGIDPKNKNKVFDPYFSTKSEGDGTGLGLYMAKTIIEKHDGGKLNFENTDDGVRFIVIL